MSTSQWSSTYQALTVESATRRCETWTLGELQELEALAREGLTQPEIAERLSRTLFGVMAMAPKVRVSGAATVAATVVRATAETAYRGWLEGQGDE